MTPRAADERRPRTPPAYWAATLRLSGGLLAVWFAVSFGVAWWARELDAVVFGWPFSFWVAAQGALIVYCAIVVVYARAMDRLDHRHDVAEDIAD